MGRRDRLKQGESAELVHLVEAPPVVGGDERLSGEMDEPVERRFGHFGGGGGGIGEIGGEDPAVEARRGPNGEDVGAGKTVGARDGDPPQNDPPACTRARSASTIIAQRLSRSVPGSQPSSERALAASPIRRSTSAGR